MCPTLCDPMDCSLQGSSVHGVLQARILVWAPCPSPGDIFDPGIKPKSLMPLHWQVGSLSLRHQGSPADETKNNFFFLCIMFKIVYKLLLWSWECCISSPSLVCQTIAAVFIGEQLVHVAPFTITTHEAVYGPVQGPGTWDFTSWHSLQWCGSCCIQQAEALLVLNSAIKWGQTQRGLHGKPQRWLKGWKVRITGQS